MRVIFPAAPFAPNQPDRTFAREVAAADAAGLARSLLDYEALVNDQDVARAVRRVPTLAAPEAVIYRGWMLRPTDYARLHAALAARGARLLTSPTAYRYCHYLPEWYGALAGSTPRSLWLPHASGSPLPLDAIMARLATFGSAPLIVKDYVTSRKHEWAEACYIPSAADRAAVERVISRFLALQGDDLNEGLVFREFVPLEPLAVHSRSGMPLAVEHRIFYLDGAPLDPLPYWEEGVYAFDPPPLEPFRTLASRIPSPFFAMDVARRADGEWIVIELGDGQVAGLPARADALAFYSALACWRESLL